MTDLLPNATRLRCILFETIACHQPTSALGHKRTFRSAIAMSALPPKADIASSEGLLCVTGTSLGAPILRPRTGKIRARIAPATFCQRVRSALFKRAILAVPILAIVDHGAPGRYVGRRRQAENQLTN